MSPRTVAGMSEAVSEQRLRDAHCWEPGDVVPGRPHMTAFRRRLRYRQAQWREANGYPMGTQPIVPKPGASARLVGSRIPLAYARETGANFLSDATLRAVRARTATKEPHQSFDQQRLWADLLWPMALCFNLFGELAGDLARADRAVHQWWPDAPGTVSEVRFEHSPGWLDPAYLGNLSSFDVAFVLDIDDESRGIIGLKVKYHELIRPHEPKPARLPRYIEIARRSTVFGRGALAAVNGTDLLETWLEHLLVLSMLQQPSRRWTWGRYVLVCAAGNADFTSAATRYRQLLADDATFDAVTLEHLCGREALPAHTVRSFRDRYLAY